MGVENVPNNPSRVEIPGNCNPWTKNTSFCPLSVPPSPQSTDIPSLLAEERRRQSSNGDMWSLYNSQAEKHDLQLVERWKRQTDTMINVAGFFSIVVSIFLVRAIGGLKPNSSELLLAQISLQLSQPPSVTSIPLPDVLFPPPTRLDIAVNVLWTLSLGLSLTCTLSAILAQEWMQEYLYYSQCHNTPSTRARIRAYLFDGLRGYRLDKVISVIPLLLHLAILLFGAGLITYFFTFNNVVAYTALVAYAIAATQYLLLTISPLISLVSPFKTPISNFLWRIMHLIWFPALHITQNVTSYISPDTTFSRFRLPKIISAYRERYHGGIVRGLEQDLESTSPNMDTYSLRWVVLSLQGDDALESFIAAIPRFLDTESGYYPQYTIGNLLEDRDVRLGWIIGRLLQTCATSFCILEPNVRKRRAIACARAVWSITEKFAGTSTLYWDNLFGAETGDALSTLAKDSESSIALVARCTASLAARSCLRELIDVSAWTQTKGPHWAHRAQHLAGYVIKLSGISLPLESDAIARDGPLLILRAFLSAPPFIETGADELFMINTTVKHLMDGVRAGDASLDAQKQFSVIFAQTFYGCWGRYLDKFMRDTVVSLLQELTAQIPEDRGPADVDADCHVLQEHGGYGIIPPQRRHAATWSSYPVPGRAFSGDATASYTGFGPCYSPRNESPLETVVGVPPIPVASRLDAGF